MVKSEGASTGWRKRRPPAATGAPTNWRKGLQLTTLLLGVTVSLKAYTLGVVYPKLRAPFDQVYIALYKGISQAHGGEVALYEFDRDASQQQFNSWLSAQGNDGVIALGNRSINAIKQAPEPPSVTLLGGTILNPQLDPEAHGVSLAPSPKALFTELRLLAPKVKEVLVVYESDTERWLIERARISARELNLELTAYPASSIKEMAEHYRDILNRQTSDLQALWLPKSGQSLEKALVYDILEKAWQRKLIAFSSNFADVKNGFLFSMLPDNEAIGARLYNLYLEAKQHLVPRNTVLLAEDVHRAINIRTASHLGMHLSKEEMDRYKFIFPSK